MRSTKCWRSSKRLKQTAPRSPISISAADWAFIIAPQERQMQNRRLELNISSRACSIMLHNAVTRTARFYLNQSGEKRFAIVDAAMNDLMRPAMYQAYHDINPVIQRKDAMPALYDVAGPICESGDWLGRARRLAVQPGDLLAVHGAGAYGFVMSSNYNTRPRAAEVMVDGAQAYLIRERETVEQLFAGEARLPADALSYSQARHHAAQAAKIL